MKSSDLDRIRYITRYLGDLQSGVLSILPLGLFCLFCGLWSYSGSGLWFWPAMLVFLEGSRFMRVRGQRYLGARFGRAEKKKWAVLEGVRLSPIFVKVVFACLFVSFVVSRALGSSIPDRLFYFCIGGQFVFRFIYREYRLAEAYNLGIAALFLAIATRGAFSALTLPAWLWNNSGMPDILCGSALILSCLVDYWQLARTLPPIAEESEALVAEEAR